MRIFFSPDSQQPGRLRAAYRQAFREAVEIYVASAYLTDWQAVYRLNTKCARAVFLIGTDFGLTRKAALRHLLHWIPKRTSSLVLAVPRQQTGGFHPKFLLWRTSGQQCYCLVGSSNLSKAAFETNYEVNALARVSFSEYQRLAKWLDMLADNAIPITEDWIEHHYKEAPIRSSGQNRKGRKAAAIHLHLPIGSVYARRVRERRAQQTRFNEIAAPLLSAARQCAKGRMSDIAFWERFWKLWSKHASRFQGSGIQFSGKHARWHQACHALITIIESKPTTDSELDHIVAREIDLLTQLSNPARGAWLTEMLCHYLPNRYPVHNGPVRKWLSWNKWRGRRGATEGQRYIELARQLREAVRQRPSGARNLAELDLAIWQWVYNREH